MKNAIKKLSRTLTLSSSALVILFVPKPATAQSEIKVDGLEVEQGSLPITVSGEKFNLEARVFHPPGNGPFPLVIINHGTPISIADAGAAKLGFTQAAEWFAHNGSVVVVPLRPGFGNSDGPYMEPEGRCNNRDYVSEGRETAKVEAAIVASAAKFPDVDAIHIIVVGHSAGGFGAIALGDEPPSGVIGIINFAGGRGGDDNEEICGGKKRLIDATRDLGSNNQIPQLWLYGANDHFFPPSLGHALFDAYKEGSKAPMTFVDLPSFGKDGHQILSDANPSVWSEPVSQFIGTVMKH